MPRLSFDHYPVVAQLLAHAYYASLLWLSNGDHHVVLLRCVARTLGLAKNVVAIDLTAQLQTYQ